jgi:hypothetical protein
LRRIGAGRRDAEHPAGVRIEVEFGGRELHLIKKALVIAVLVIERLPGPFQSSSDQADMKAMLDPLLTSNTEVAHYARAARIAATGESD